MLAPAAFSALSHRGNTDEGSRGMPKYAQSISNRARVWDGAEQALFGFDTDPAGAIMAGVGKLRS